VRPGFLTGGRSGVDRASAAGRLGRSGAKQVHIRSTRRRPRVEPGSITGRRRPRVDRWPPIDPVDPGSTPDSFATRSTQVRSTQSGSTQATSGRPRVDPASIADWPGVDPWSTADRSGRPDVVPEPTRCQNLIPSRPPVDRRSARSMQRSTSVGQPVDPVDPGSIWVDARFDRVCRGSIRCRPQGDPVDRRWTGSTRESTAGRPGSDPGPTRIAHGPTPGPPGLTEWPTRRPEIDCGSTPGRSGIDRQSTLDQTRFDCGSNAGPLADGDRPVAADAVEAAPTTRGDPESTDGRVGIDHE